MAKNKYRYEGITPSYNILKDKDKLVDQYIHYMLDRTQMIFKYNNLPDTIPQREIELILQVNGHCTIAEKDGKLYVFFGQLGGVPNEYYLPTLSIVANPYLAFNKSLEIDKNCVVIRNDAMYQGLMPMFDKWSQLLAECVISLRFATINSRVPALVSADNDKTYNEAKTFFKQVDDGKEIGLIGNNAFFEGLKVYDYASKATNVKELLELVQYIKSNWYLDLGVQANYNMKREALNSSEVSLNEDALMPLIDQMLKERQEGVDRVNKMFGTNITVELNDVWKQLRTEIELALKAKQLESEPEPEPDTTEETDKEDDNNEVN